MDARILQVSSSHASSGRMSRRSEISSMGGLEWRHQVWVSKTLYASQFSHLDLVTKACSEASVTLGADFVVLSVFLELVT